MIQCPYKINVKQMKQKEKQGRRRRTPQKGVILPQALAAEGRKK